MRRTRHIRPLVALVLAFLLRLLAPPAYAVSDCAILGDQSASVRSGAQLIEGSSTLHLCSIGPVALGSRAQVESGGRIAALDVVPLKSGSRVSGALATTAGVALGPTSSEEGNVRAGGDAVLRAGARIGGDLEVTGTAGSGPGARAEGTITVGSRPPGLVPELLSACSVEAPGGEPITAVSG